MGICWPYGLAVASYDLPAWILVSQNASGKDTTNNGCQSSWLTIKNGNFFRLNV